MSDRLRRIRRLHGIRRIQAEVEETSLRQLQNNADLIQQDVDLLRHEIRKTLLLPTSSEASCNQWQITVAERTLARHNLQSTILANEQIKLALEEQRFRYRDSCQQHEQIGLVLEDAQRAECYMQDRNVQHMLDDLFAASSRRKQQQA